MVICFWTCVHCQTTKDCPDWTSGNIENPIDYYYGIGYSEKTSEEADDKARTEFAKMYQSKVASSTSLSEIETGTRVKTKYKQASIVSTEITLHGISITDRCKDSVYYWSLLKIEKEVYDKIVEEAKERKFKEEEDSKDKALQGKRNEEVRENLRRENELESYQHRISQQAKADSIKLVKHREKLKNDAKKHDLKLQKLAARRSAKQQLGAYRHNRYQHFHSMPPPRQAISVTTGELLNDRYRHNFSAGLVIAPIAINNLDYTYHIWLIESSVRLRFIDNKAERQELSLKMQALSSKGDYYKTSIAIGAIEYLGGISETDTELLKPKYSPLVAGNIAMPHWRYSHLSFYGDARMISLGINSYIFFDNFNDDSFCLVGQVNYIEDKSFRNRFNEKIEFEAGFQFKTLSQLTLMISYEDHEYFKIIFDYAL